MSPFRRRAGGGKRDKAEKQIVDGLRAMGYSVAHIGGTGNPDIAVRKHYWPAGLAWNLEVKSKGGSRTNAQEQSQWPIVHTVEEAIAVIVGSNRG